MSSVSRSSLTLLEDLPNELFLELFSYFWAFDLFYSWSKLNKRLSGLLKSLNLFIYINNTQDFTKQETFFNRCSEQIISLKEFRRYPHAPLDFRHLTNLRSLVLSGYHFEQTEMLKSSFLPHLEYLTLNYSSAPYELFERILFSTSEHLSNLIYLNVDAVKWSEIRDRIEPLVNMTLRTLCFNKDYPVPLNQLEFSFPNLIVFKGAIETSNEHLNPHSMLRRIDVSIDYYNPNVEQFLLSIPKLTYLRLECVAHSWAFFNQLASILDHSQYLKQVRLKIHYEPDRIDFFDLKQLRSMSDKWFRTLQLSHKGTQWEPSYVFTPKRDSTNIKNT